MVPRPSTKLVAGNVPQDLPHRTDGRLGNCIRSCGIWQGGHQGGLVGTDRCCSPQKENDLRRPSRPCFREVRRQSGGGNRRTQTNRGRLAARIFWISWTSGSIAFPLGRKQTVKRWEGSRASIAVTPGGPGQVFRDPIALVPGRGRRASSCDLRDPLSRPTFPAGQATPGTTLPGG